MKTRRTAAVLLVLLLSLSVTEQASAAKKFTCTYKITRKQGDYTIDKDEVLSVDYDSLDVTRKSFGLLAKNVTYFGLGAASTVLVGQKKNTLYHVDLLQKTGKNKDIRYKSYRITDKAKEVYPYDVTAMFYRNKKNEICYTGVGLCHLLFNHTTQKQCDKEFEKQVRNRVVLKDVKKCWSDDMLFAYVKDNNLYITGQALTFDWSYDLSDDLYDDWKYDLSDQRSGCFFEENVKECFIGKGNQVKQVISGGNKKGYMIFVVLKDGSVWGIGDNSNKMIKNEPFKVYNEFVKVVSGGVKEIDGNGDNIGILKKDGTLWVWGRSLNKGKKKYSTTPKKVASDVKEFSICTSILFLKKNNVAYGMGSNACYTLSNQYSTSWKSKPVKLMENVKHVYAGDVMTFLLTRKNELYWSGVQEITYPYWW